MRLDVSCGSLKADDVPAVFSPLIESPDGDHEESDAKREIVILYPMAQEVVRDSGKKETLGYAVIALDTMESRSSGSTKPLAILLDEPTLRELRSHGDPAGLHWNLRFNGMRYVVEPGEPARVSQGPDVPDQQVQDMATKLAFDSVARGLSGLAKPINVVRGRKQPLVALTEAEKLTPEKRLEMAQAEVWKLHEAGQSRTDPELKAALSKYREAAKLNGLDRDEPKFLQGC